MTPPLTARPLPQDFLETFVEGAAVLRSEDDWAELGAAYLKRAEAMNVTRAEIQWDPQDHMER